MVPPPPATTRSLWDGDIAERRCPYAVSRNFTAALGEPVIKKYGQEFVWTSNHWRVEELEPLRLLGDAEMDPVLDELAIDARDDIIACLRAAPEKPHAAALLVHTDAVPHWVNWDIISLGQNVFCRHLPAASLVLSRAALNEPP